MRQRWTKRICSHRHLVISLQRYLRAEVENLVAGYTEIGAVTEEAVLAYGDVTISTERGRTGMDKVHWKKYLQQSLQQILNKKVEDKVV